MKPWNICVSQSKILSKQSNEITLVDKDCLYLNLEILTETIL